MTTPLLHVRVLATIALALAGGSLLTGCTADAAQNAVNGAVQGATNGDVSATVGSAGLVSMKNDNYTVVVAGSPDGLLYTVTPIS